MRIISLILEIIFVLLSIPFIFLAVIVAFIIQKLEQGCENGEKRIN